LHDQKGNAHDPDNGRDHQQKTAQDIGAHQAFPLRPARRPLVSISIKAFASFASSRS
jgi:hypothetical protein